MRKTFLKAGKPLAAAGFAAVLFLFPAPAWGQDVLPPNPSGNTFTVNSAVSGNVYGGRTDGGAASNNNVTVTSGANVIGEIFGGRVDSGTGTSANYNTVTINSGTVRDLYGAYSQGKGEVVGNKVIINGGNVLGIDATGSKPGTLITGGYIAITTNNISSNNSVTINGGNIGYLNESLDPTASGSNPTRIYGGRGQNTSSITNNTVTINGGNISKSEIYGGDITNGSSKATVDQNSVNITGGTIEANVYGGHANTGGGITNNKVSMTGGAVTGKIYGGYSNGSGNVTGNEVSIYGGTVNAGSGPDEGIYGGWSKTGLASGNRVNVGGPANVTGNIFGNNSGVFAGDTFAVMESNNAKVNGNISGFEKYRFCLPPSLPTLNAALNVSGNVNFIDASSTKQATVIEVHIMNEGPVAKLPSEITLLRTGSFNDKISNDSQYMNVMQDTTLYFKGQLVQDATNLKIVFDTAQAPKVTPHTNANVEGSLTGTAPLLVGTADLVAGAGISQAVEATAETAEAVTSETVGFTSEAKAVSEECLSRGNCLKSFTALSGGHLRYNTDSKADVNSVSILTGLARGVELSPGRLTVGGFLEYGFGDYSTDSTFPDIREPGKNIDIKGSGQAWHLGGGLLGRLNLNRTGPGHPYVEGSLRAGEIHNYYGYSGLEVMGYPEWMEFDTSTPYYGAHFGLGYLWNLSGATSLDTYAKYLWTRIEGESITLPSLSTSKGSTIKGGTIDFKDVTSQRLFTGVRLSHALNEKVSPYIGAAYEYEFDSKARATTRGLPIDSHSFGGSTEIGEVGLSFKPDPARLVTLDFGLQGYTGVKEGITGSIQLKVEF